jgi:cell division protein ZapA
MSQLEVQILHQDYLLTCPDGREAQLLEAVERVDQQFQQMRETGKLRSRERIGVLLAVNLAYENLELRNQLQALQQKMAQHQSFTETQQADVDAERLVALETQAQTDQHAAAALLARLDEVLADNATATAPVDDAVEQVAPLTPAEMLPTEDLQAVMEDSEPASTAQDTQPQLITTNLESSGEEGLSAAKPESL